jgi:prephenate dehydrogenase
MPLSQPVEHTPRWDTVTIVGMGMIGTSLGIELMRRGVAGQVIGVGRDPKKLHMAETMGACTSVSTSLPASVTDTQLVVVCTPVSRIVADVRQAAACCRHETLITDVGSTKAAIVAELDRGLPPAARFIGSHPLAGSEKTGPTAAMQNLFEGRTVVVTPGKATRPADAAQIAAFWKALGAKVTQMDPAEHDRVVAGSSHLPHLVSSALAAATPRECLPLVAGGWADTTRVAGGDPQLWTDILLENKDNVLASLATFETVLGRFRQALSHNDARALVEVLQEAKRIRDALGS